MIGRVVGHFEIREKIGAGAMGEVYLAWDAHLRRKVALKFLPPSTIANVVAKQRLRREALALSRLNHPAVATLYDYYSDSEHDCLVMEFVEGESLDRIARRGPLDESLLLRYAVQIADGLAAAHAAKVVHRDLKPANLRITPEGRVKILDFGLAKQVAQSAGSTTSTPSSDSSGGEVAGTLAYIAPEVWSGEPFTAAADLFSLGVVLFELATGARPFEGLTGSALVHAIKEESPGSARSRRPSLSGEMDAIITRLLSKRPADRYASARELHDELEALHNARSGPSPSPQPAPPPAPARPWRWQAVSTLGGAAVLLALAFWIWGRQKGTAVVAVLPFTDLSEASVGAHFADGVTEELTSRLAEHDSLQVVSFTTMSRYRGSVRRVPDIAREVGATRIVQGSVRREGMQVRFSLQIIEGATDHALWSRRFKGHLADIVQVEEQIARELAHKMRGRPTSASRSGDAAARVDPVAHDLFQRARYELQRRNDEGIRRARALFERSLQLDSTFAPAWAGLADAWSAAGYTGLERPLAAFPQARQAARRALELDPNLADGHVSLGNVLQNHDWDWDAAERAYLRAIALNPNHSVAHHWYASHLALRGQFEHALQEIERARSLDPYSLSITTGPAAFLYFARRYTEALVALDAAIALDSTSGLVQRARAAILDRLGREDEAMQAVGVWLDGQNLRPLSAALANAYAAGGLRAALHVLIEGLERKRAAGLYEPATHIAELHARLGEREPAMRWLAEAERERDTELNRLRVDPIFDPLRGDPRFQALLGRVGLEDDPASRADAADVAPGAM